jgi:hypothetical protein
MRKERKVATLKEIFSIRDKLALVVRKVGEDTCEYIDKHISDQTVAAELDAPIGAVQRIRRDQYGNLRNPSGGPAGNAELRTEIEQLKAQLMNAAHEVEDLKTAMVYLHRAYDDLRDRFTKLCIKLQTERVADTKYLGEGIAAFKNGPAPTVETRR